MMNLTSHLDSKIMYPILWGTLICIAVFSLLYLLRCLIVKKLSKRIGLSKNLVDDLFLGLVINTKKTFYFLTGVFLGSLCIDLTVKQRTVVEKAYIIILFVQFAFWANWIVSFWIDHHLKTRSLKNPRIASTFNLINLASKSIIYGLVVLIALNNLGIDITAFIAGLGIGGIAIALALKSILSDLFASLTIVLDKPFVVGDFIVIGEYEGTIERIGLKTTRLTSLSGEQLIFGNEDLLQSRIRNYQIMAERRVEQKIRVTYDTSLDLLKLIPVMVKASIESEEKTRFERCHLMNYHEFSLEFILVYWVQSADYNVYTDIAQIVNFNILEKFNEKNIKFAFPTSTLNLKTQQDVIPQPQSETPNPQIVNQSSHH